MSQDLRLESDRAEVGFYDEMSTNAAGQFQINWTNRGADNFGVFGARAEDARRIVDTVFDMWENIIVDMHDQGNRNYINVDVFMANETPGFGGGARLQEWQFGFPVRGDIELGVGTAGQPDLGWFLDPSPQESSEFQGNIVNAFAGDAQAGSPAFNKPDFFTVVNSEIIHLLGITSQGSVHWVDQPVANGTGVADGNEGGGIGQLYYIKNASINQLLTTNNGGSGGTDTGEPLHTSPGAHFVEAAVGWVYGSEDAGNASYENGRRYLPPNNIAQLLNHGYGYEYRDPELQGTFYSMRRFDGTVKIRGGAGNSNDIIDVYRDFATNEIVAAIDVGIDVNGTGPTDAFVSRFPVTSVASINIEGFGGADRVTINSNIGIPVTLDLGAGDDRVVVRGKGLGIGGAAVDVNVVGSDDGVDTLELFNERTGDNINVDSTGLTSTGGFNIAALDNFEHLVINTHFGQNDIRMVRANTFQTFTVNANPQGGVIHLNELAGAPVRVNGSNQADTLRLRWSGNGFVSTNVLFFGNSGADTLELSNGDLGRVTGRVDFSPGLGQDQIIFNDQNSIITSAQYQLGTDSFRVIDAFTDLFHTFGDTEIVRVRGDSGANTFTVAPAALYSADLAGNNGNDTFNGGGSNRATLRGGEGDDDFRVGNGDVSQTAGLVDMQGEGGSDTLTIDDSVGTSNLPWTINGFTGDPGNQQRAFLGIFEYGYAGFENLRLLGSPLSQNFTLNGGFNQGVEINAGGGTDTILLDDVVNYNRADGVSPISIDGGSSPAGGLDKLIVSDTGTTFAGDYFLRQRNVFLIDENFFGHSIDYAAIEHLQVFASDGATNLTVLGTSPDITGQTSFFLGGGNDIATVYTRDEFGNPSILSPIGILGHGGSDTVTYLDSPAPFGPALTAGDSDGPEGVPGVNWSIASVSGGPSTVISGFGANVGLGTDIEALNFVGGDGPDNIAVNAAIPLAINLNGGAGDDVIDVVKTPGPFHVSGGDGGDMLQQRFDLVAFLPDRVAVTDNSLVHYRRAQFGGPFLPLIETTYSPDLEAISISSTASAAFLEVVSTQPGARVSLVGSAGVDTFYVGSAGVAIGVPGNPGTTQNIRGPVFIEGSGNDSLTINDAADTVGRFLHALPYNVGGIAGDDLFGDGGSAFFSGVTSVTVNLGSGADLVYAQPNSAMPVNINMGGTPDDLFFAALAATVNPVITQNGANGSITCDNLFPLGFTGIDNDIVVDDLAPVPQAADFFYDLARQTLSFSFSEDVSATLNPGYVSLTDLDTAEMISTGLMSLAYDLETQSAAVEFPGLPNGALPDGNYRAQLTPGYLDVFGNEALVSIEVDFFTLAGDANRDRSVNLNDFTILAATFGQTGRVFSEGNFDYDPAGAVNLDDFTILASQFGASLPAPGSLPRGAAVATGLLPSRSVAAVTTAPLRPASRLAGVDLLAGQQVWSSWSDVQI
ncbi:MAG TPA: hypothetical protein PLD59_04390 [Tepidisphaeraceae bacterium]|mgnify:CR=1 FL=1|nr:hypothetical protein [Tepidisphaeraceae bacterium]